MCLAWCISAESWGLTPQTASLLVEKEGVTGVGGRGRAEQSCPPGEMSGIWS